MSTSQTFLLVCAVFTLILFKLSTPVHSICLARSFLTAIASPYCDFDDYYINATLPQNLAASLASWKFSSKQLLLNEFPIDPETRNFVRRVQNVVFSRAKPVPLNGELRLAAWSEDVLTDCLDLNLGVVNTKEFLYVFSGNQVLNQSTPLAHRYGGHQFGSWAGQLGDGRAHLLGEYVSERGERWEIQLKGSGKTPYSRAGDGRAIIRSSVREFLASEAMFYLGVPTSRAGSLIVSDESVRRDLLYNGHVTLERTAVVLRLAPSWFRFGSFEILAQSQEIKLLKQLTDFVINTNFNKIQSLSGSARYLALFSAVVTQTAALMAKWMSRGFAHGVCNTDNFSILSVTIDYGPYRFLDEYQPDMVPNLSDDEQRYSYRRQPSVGHYNLAKLQLALSPLLPPSDQKHMSQTLASYDRVYQDAFRKEFREKLGLADPCSKRNDVDDDELIKGLLDMMADVRSDFTMTFRQLGDIPTVDDGWKSINYNDKRFWALKVLSGHVNYAAWLKSFALRLESCDVMDHARKTATHRVNPRYILRNWMAQQAIEATDHNDFSVVREMHAVLRQPFTVQDIAEARGYADRPPVWAENIKVSCSS